MSRVMPWLEEEIGIECIVAHVAIFAVKINVILYFEFKIYIRVIYYFDIIKSLILSLFLESGPSRNLFLRFYNNFDPSAFC